MSKETKNRIVPDLRLPEFKGGGEWDEKALGNICSNIASGKDKLSEKGEFDLFGSTGIIGKTDDFSYNGNYILVARVGANAGLLTRASGKFGVTDNTLVIFQNNNENLDFVYYTLERFGLNKLVFGSGQPLITGGQLKSLIIYLPNPIEQQKIADCLSSLDEYLTAQGQKLDALKAHKKGLMQQLFPAEGETVPKLRFKEFRDSGEWEENSLENLSTKISDGIHSTPVYDDDGEYYFINGNNLFDGNIYIDEKTKRVSEEEYQKHKRELNPNSILLSINGTIGNIAIYNNEKVILGKSACYINVDESKANMSFIKFFLQTEIVTRYFNTELTGSTIKNLSLKTIKNTLVNLPDPIEQQKIADCLSSLDDLITAQAEKIEALKRHKQGLMQGLFPNINNQHN